MWWLEVWVVVEWVVVEWVVVHVWVVVVVVVPVWVAVCVVQFVHVAVAGGEGWGAQMLPLPEHVLEGKRAQTQGQAAVVVAVHAVLHNVVVVRLGTYRLAFGVWSRVCRTEAVCVLSLSLLWESHLLFSLQAMV